jgi:hypothetical protein
MSCVPSKVTVIPVSFKVSLVGFPLTKTFKFQLQTMRGKNTHLFCFSAIIPLTFSPFMKRSTKISAG